MKVLMIGSHLRVTGGITRVVKNYIQAGLGKKVNLEYFPTYYGSNHPVNILYFVSQYLKLFFKLKVLKQRYDIAHVHMSYRGSFLRKRPIIQLLESEHIPVLLHMHGSQFKDFYNESSPGHKQSIKDTLNKVSTIIALGNNWKEYYGTICNTRVHSLDNAVFPKKFDDSVVDDKIYITTMGVLSKRKGTYDLIQVAAKLNDRIDKKYKFFLAGDGEIAKAKELVNQLGLEDRVVFPGWISDESTIDEIYRKSIIYVLPSYNEGMPMSILEAMSYGLPVISTDVGSISSVIEDGENGFLLKPGDVEDIVSKIEYLLNNQSIRLSMQQENLNKISRKFNIYENLDELLELYKK